MLVAALGWFSLLGDGIGGFKSGTARPPGPEWQMQKYAPGRILVKFKGVQTQARSDKAGERAMLDSLPATAVRALEEIRGTVRKVFPFIGVLNVQIPPEISVEQAIEALYRSGTVEYAEPDFLDLPMVTPNDPRFADQWGLNNTGQGGGTPEADIRAPEAWEVRTGADQTIVVVLDTGVDYNHEDLAANMWSNPNEIPNNGIDDDGNGYIDDVYGMNAYDNNGDPMDANGHGTHVAGIIAAVGNNGAGVSGVVWNTRIMALRMASPGGSASFSDIIECMQYALASKQANNYPRMVWNYSFGGTTHSQARYDALVQALDAGVLFVPAAGNDNVDIDVSIRYPVGYDLANIIGVAASDHGDLRSWFSNWGATRVDLFAPGSEILSTTRNNTYEAWDGTSMATPFVTGAGALLWSQRPSLSWQEIKGLILNGVDDGKAFPEFAGRCVTEGRLNLKNSLADGLVKAPAVFAATPATAKSGDTITITGVNLGFGGTLRFKGSAFPSRSWSNTQILAVIPGPIPGGTGRLTVTTAEGTSRGAWMNITPGPGPGLPITPIYNLLLSYLHHFPPQRTFASLGSGR